MEILFHAGHGGRFWESPTALHPYYLSIVSNGLQVILPEFFQRPEFDEPTSSRLCEMKLDPKGATRLVRGFNRVSVNLM
jgi:hypothetical protein